MKKIIVALFAICFGLAVVAPADAETTTSVRCCDGDNQMRCRLEKPEPLGSECYCLNQGYGKVC